VFEETLSGKKSFSKLKLSGSLGMSGEFYKPATKKNFE
jgi:hypothetical protein